MGSLEISGYGYVKERLRTRQGSWTFAKIILCFCTGLMDLTSKAPDSNTDSDLRLRAANLIYTALHDLTGHEFEVISDEGTIYIYHSDRNISKKAAHDCILHAVYGIMLSTDVRSLYIEGLGKLTYSSIKKHISLALRNAR